MKSAIGVSLLLGALALSLCLVPPASAQFTRVLDIPVTELFSLSAKGDTIAAGADTAIYVSTNAGATWQRSARPAAGVASIQAVVIRNGRLYAGTFGQGVFISDNLGATWQAFNQGLVGGILNSQLFISDLVVRGDTLYAATSGAGVYLRGLTGGTWSPFGTVWEPNQAPNVNSLALGGVRLLASAGANGQVFTHDSGDADWTVSNLDNVGLHPGRTAMTAVFNGFGWVVGTNSGAFHSIAGQEPWTPSGPLAPVSWTAFATQGRHLFAAFDTQIDVTFGESSDDGATWQDLTTVPGLFVKALAVVGTDLYSAQGNGLWRRPLSTASVPPDAPPRGLRFALAGAQPFGDQAHLRFDMPESGTASIEVFDVAGRRAGGRIEEWWSSGPHEVTLDARDMGPGVYAARLTAAGASEVVRLVHMR